MEVRILIIGDLHGEYPKFKKKDVDLILVTGDIFKDTMRKYYDKWRHVIEETGNIFYSFDRVCPPWKQKILDWVAMRRAQKIINIFEKRKIPTCIVPGNWDNTEMLDGRKVRETDDWSPLFKGKKIVHDIDGKVIRIGELTLVGHGAVSSPEVTMKPRKKDYELEEEYEEEMAMFEYFDKKKKKIMKELKKSDKNIILLSHNVPYDTKLDIVKIKRSVVYKQHCGSIFAREFIEKKNPLMCVGGHIHEGQGKTKLNKTVCINAGYGADINTYVVIDTKKSKVKSVEVLGKNKSN